MHMADALISPTVGITMLNELKTVEEIVQDLVNGLPEVLTKTQNNCK